MSVRTWKRIITLTVLVVICALTISTIVLGSRTATLNGLLAEAEAKAEADAQAREEYVRTHLAYQNEYPNLYVENDFIFNEVDENKKICYLTFDDGPNAENTAMILDTLNEYGIKATFFVIMRTGEAEQQLYKRMIDEGHTIGVHTSSHDYEKIYSSVEDYLADFSAVSDYVESITGVKPEIFRFPGGSINSYNRGIYMELISEMTRRGYVYYDWSHTSMDAAASGIPVSTIVSSSTTGSSAQKILLMHDGAGHRNTALALPQVIEILQDQGYTFEALTKDVQPVDFGYTRID